MGIKRHLKRGSFLFLVLALALITLGLRMAQISASGNDSEVPAADSSAIWNFDCVDCLSDERVRSIAMVMDSADMPHIVYIAESWPTSGIEHLKYAQGGMGNWNISIVDDTGDLRADRKPALQIDAADNLHAIYVDSNLGLRYGQLITTSWQLETIDSNREATYVSLALDDAGSPHVAYSTELGNRLWYATIVSDTWTIEELQFTNVARHNEIAIDSNGRPHLAYQTCSTTRQGDHSVAAGFCSSGHPIVAYSYFDGIIWQTETVDDGVRQGFYLTMALDENDAAHVVYNVGAPLELLNYATNRGGSWQLEIIATSPNGIGYGWGNDVAVDSTGAVHASYYRALLNGDWELLYAKRQAINWSVSTLEMATGGGEFTGIALDSSGKPTIGFRSESQPTDLRIAFQIEPTQFNYLPIVSTP